MEERTSLTFFFFFLFFFSFYKPVLRQWDLTEIDEERKICDYILRRQREKEIKPNIKGNR